MVWIEDPKSHNSPLSQNLKHRKDSTLFKPVKPKRYEKTAEENSETSRGWFMMFKESCLHNIKVEDDAESINVETSSYPENLSKIITESGYTGQQIFPCV